MKKETYICRFMHMRRTHSRLGSVYKLNVVVVVPGGETAPVARPLFPFCRDLRGRRQPQTILPSVCLPETRAAYAMVMIERVHLLSCSRHLLFPPKKIHLPQKPMMGDAFVWERERESACVCVCEEHTLVGRCDTHTRARRGE